jgi:bifunctional DNase/RNase
MEIRLDGPTFLATSQNLFAQYVERGGKRALTISVSQETMENLVIALNGVQTPRPLVHQLLANIINTLGAGVDRVVIDDFKDEFYHSHIYVQPKDGGEPLAIAAHVTDALILAAHENAAVFTTEEMFKHLEELPKRKPEEIDDEVMDQIDWDNVPKS